MTRPFILHPFAFILFFAFGVCGAAPACLGNSPSPGFLGYFPGGGFTLAQIPEVSPAFGPWVNQLFVALGIVAFVLMIVGQGKALFGRTPPVAEELKALEKQIAENDRRRSVGVAGAHAKSDAQAAELRAEMGAIREQLGELERAAAKLDERTNTTNHTVDSINLKVDQLLRTAPRRAA